MTDGNTFSRRLPITLIALVVAAMMPVTLAALSNVIRGDGWTYLSDAPDHGGFGQAVGSTCSDLYIVQCYNSGSTPDFWRYSPDTENWTDLDITGLERGIFRNGTALAWNGEDRIYALCGARYTVSNPDRRIFLAYSISGDAWTPLADTPGPQGAGDAMAWSGYDDTLYAILGSNEHGTVFARYDEGGNAWETLAPPPEETDDGCSLAWAGGTTLYATQGERYQSEPSQIFWRYDIGDDSWTRMANVPDPGGVSDGGSLLWTGGCVPEQSDFIYALGGGDYVENPGAHFYRYTVPEDRWDELPSIPSPVGYFNGCRLGHAGDRIYYWQGSPSSYVGEGDDLWEYCWDSDDDGYADAICGGDDCDDNDPAAHPGAVEICTGGVDEDCDGDIDGDDLECADEFVLELDVSYGAGTLSLDYTIGAPEPVTWVNYLVLTQPDLQVIPLWTVPLPVIAPPSGIPIAFPLPAVGTAGIYTGLYSATGPEVTKLIWFGTGA